MRKGTNKYEYFMKVMDIFCNIKPFYKEKNSYFVWNRLKDEIVILNQRSLEIEIREYLETIGLWEFNFEISKHNLRKIIDELAKDTRLKQGVDFRKYGGLIQ